MRELAARLRSIVACPWIGPELDPSRTPRVEIRRKHGVVVISRMQFLNRDQVNVVFWDAEEVYYDVMGLR